MISAQSIEFYNTPPLWHGKQFDITQFEFPIIDIHSFQPQIIPQNIRLGHQMEYVFKQLIEYSELYTIDLYNLPIRSSYKTLGEIDFILNNKINHKLIHVELTYKFYIINPEAPQPIEQLIGPNKRDTFVAKMNKIKNVQFPLLHSHEGSHALQSLNIDHAQLEHQCCFKAQLFQPFGQDNILTKPLNTDCIVGYWLRFDEFNTSTFTSAQFYLPSKSEWVTKPTNQVTWKSHHDMLHDLNIRMLKEKAPLVWMKKSDSAFIKLFVVWW